MGTNENNRVPKNLNELVDSLKDSLQRLKDSLDRISSDRPEEVHTIANQLRLLICDESNKTKGILTYFLKQYNSTRSTELEKFKSTDIITTIRGYEESTTLNVCEIIKNISQQDGGVHVDLGRSPDHHEAFFLAGTLGRPSTIPMYFDELIKWGRRVLKLGEDFLIEEFNIQLRK